MLNIHSNLHTFINLLFKIKYELIVIIIYVLTQNERPLQYTGSTERKSIYGLHPIGMATGINFSAKSKVLITAFTSFLLVIVKKAPATIRLLCCILLHPTESHSYNKGTAQTSVK